jgi:hypothetical protein
VLDVLLLLPVTRRLLNKRYERGIEMETGPRTLERPDDQGGGGRNNGDCCLPILDRKLDSHP